MFLNFDTILEEFWLTQSDNLEKRNVTSRAGVDISLFFLHQYRGTFFGILFRGSAWKNESEQI